MISYELQRPRKGVFSRIADAVGFNVDPLSDESMARRMQLPRAQILPKDTLFDPATMSRLKDGTILLIRQLPDEPAWHGMGKNQYNEWMNNFVYNRFRKGDIVTLRQNPFVPGVAPAPWFTVVEFQEIHYMAQIDRTSREPKAVGVKTGDFAPVWYPPAVLRCLQPEEVKAIDILRNQAGLPRVGNVIDVEATVVDSDAGEVLKKD